MDGIRHSVCNVYMCTEFTEHPVFGVSALGLFNVLRAMTFPHPQPLVLVAQFYGPSGDHKARLRIARDGIHNETNEDGVFTISESLGPTGFLRYDMEFVFEAPGIWEFGVSVPPGNETTFALKVRETIRGETSGVDWGFPMAGRQVH